MTESTVAPKTIEIDTVKNGKANILVHWDIAEIEREDEMRGTTQTMYQYEECRMKWTLPQAYDTREDVATYLATVEDEILGYAKGAHVQMVSDTVYQCKTRKQAVARHKEAINVIVSEKTR
jgi:hypothetical protein